MQTAELTLNIWPPPYKLRYSTRAKHANLKIHPSTGLEVIIPVKSRNFDINRLLTEKRSWIEKHWSTIHAANSDKSSELPTNFFVTADKRLWKIIYQPQAQRRQLSNYLASNNSSDNRQPEIHAAPLTTKSTTSRLKLTVHEHLDLLIFTGNIDLKLVRKKLIAWLKTYAYPELATRLRAISLHTGLAYHTLAIRSQSTVWGSCNHKKHISLNVKLLFLPTILADYVLLHELCHIKYLNHGRRFWQLVHKFNNNYQILEKCLKHGDKYLPTWLNMPL